MFYWIGCIAIVCICAFWLFISIHKIFMVVNNIYNYLSNPTNLVEKNKENIIVSVLIFPFILTLQIISSGYILEMSTKVNDNNSDLITSVMQIFVYSLELSAELIMFVLLVYLLSESNKRKLNNTIWLIVLLFCAIGPVFIVNDYRIAVPIFSLTSLIISFIFTCVIKEISKRAKNNNWLKHADWIGFMGTILAAVIGLFSQK